MDGKLLLNGLFGVSKGDFDGPWEMMRLIINLVPVNQVCRSMDGDAGTLPSWAGMFAALSDARGGSGSFQRRCKMFLLHLPYPSILV